MTANIPQLACNSLGYYIAWLSLIMLPQQDKAMLAYTISGTYIVIHFLLSKHKKIDLLLLILFPIIGMIVDGTLTKLGIFQFSTTTPYIPIPFWLLLIWAIFSLLLNQSLLWLQRKPKIAIIMGALSAPLSYYAGYKLGAVNYADPIQTLGTISIIWAILLPILCLMNKRLHTSKMLY